MHDGDGDRAGNAPSCDVLVIGAGLAGTVAALAAKATGASVVVARKGYGATAFSTGALDIANTPELRVSTRSVHEHLQDIVQHRRRHPYGVLGAEKSAQGIAEGYRLLAEALAQGPLALDALELEQPNRQCLSSLGVAGSAAAVFPAHRLPVKPQSLALVGFAADPYFDSGRVRRGVTRDLAGDEDAPMLQEVVVPGLLPDCTPVGIAKVLDSDAGCAAFVEQVVAGLQGGPELDVDALVLPPYLGLAHSDRVRAQLSEALKLPVVEALAHTPSVPGLRLQLQLEATLARAGIAVVGGVGGGPHASHGPTAAGSALHRVQMLTGEALDCRSVVLASGRFVGGGILYDDGLREPLFDLDIVTEIGGSGEGSLAAMTRALPAQLQPLMTAGVWVNDELRPMREGAVAHTNLFAAGMVLGGFASRFTLCADGVALATGFFAGQAAAAAAGTAL